MNQESFRLLTTSRIQANLPITCRKCGHLHRKLGGAKTFKCPSCGDEIPRDFNGALGNFLKVLWDTSMLCDASDECAFGLSQIVSESRN